MMNKIKYFFKSRRELIANSLSDKTYKKLWLLELILLIVFLVFPLIHLGKVAIGILGICDLILIDLLAVFFAKHNINFILAILLGGIFDFAINVLILFYISAISGL